MVFSEKVISFAPDDESQKRLVACHRVLIDANYSRTTIAFGSQLYCFSLAAYCPEGGGGPCPSCRKLAETPGGLKTRGEMHGDEQADTETLDELTTAKGIAIADATVYGKHHDVEAVRYLAYVFQLAQELLLVSYRVKHLLKFKAVHLLARHGIRQELGVPVVQVAGMEDAPALRLDYPRHPAVGTARCAYTDYAILPRAAFCQPHVSILTVCPTVSVYVFAQDIGYVLPLFSPLKYFLREVVLMEVAGEDIQGFLLSQH